MNVVEVIFYVIGGSLIVSGVAWAIYDAGYDRGWLDHSKGRTRRTRQPE